MILDWVPDYNHNSQTKHSLTHTPYISLIAVITPETPQETSRIQTSGQNLHNHPDELHKQMRRWLSRRFTRGLVDI